MVLIFREAYAVLPNPRLPGNAAGQPLLFTNLRSAAPKVLLNAELGDSGVPGPGHRGRWADEVGYDPRLHTIRSLRKVTVWGSTFAVSDLHPLLEQALPRRFGGSHADYQLVEEQDGSATPILRLVVDPRAGGASISFGQILGGLGRAGVKICAIAPMTETMYREEGDWYAAQNPQLRIFRYLVPYYNTESYKPSHPTWRRGNSRSRDWRASSRRRSAPIS